MTKAKDLTGKKFNRLEAVEPIGRSPKGAVIWKFSCECGNTHEAVGWKVSTGHTKSCGCYKSERAARHARTLHEEKHGMSKTRPYRIWHGMRQRCQNPNNKKYELYGGSGVEVCDRWNDFSNFWEDMKNGYSDDLSLDRIDGDGDYEPENCRWATDREQAENSDNAHKIEIDGEKKTIKMWCKEFGVNVNTARVRIHRGWDDEEAVKTKPE